MEACRSWSYSQVPEEEEEEEEEKEFRRRKKERKKERGIKNETTTVQ